MAKYNTVEPRNERGAYLKLVNKSTQDRLEKQIVRILKKEKKYLQRDYSASQLAKDLQTNTRYLSAVLRMRFGMNYTMLVNHYRLCDAKAILRNEEYARLTIEDVGFMVGFANRQSFYAAFYRQEGITPKQYKLTTREERLRKRKEKRNAE